MGTAEMQRGSRDPYMHIWRTPTLFLLLLVWCEHGGSIPRSKSPVSPATPPSPRLQPAISRSRPPTKAFLFPSANPLSPLSPLKSMNGGSETQVMQQQQAQRNSPLLVSAKQMPWKLKGSCTASMSEALNGGLLRSRLPPKMDQGSSDLDTGRSSGLNLPPKLDPGYSDLDTGRSSGLNLPPKLDPGYSDLDTGRSSGLNRHFSTDLDTGLDMDATVASRTQQDSLTRPLRTCRKSKINYFESPVSSVSSHGYSPQAGSKGEELARSTNAKKHNSAVQTATRPVQTAPRSAVQAGPISAGTLRRPVASSSEARLAGEEMTHDLFGAKSVRSKPGVSSQPVQSHFGVSSIRDGARFYGDRVALAPAVSQDTRRALFVGTPIKNRDSLRQHPITPRRTLFCSPGKGGAESWREFGEDDEDVHQRDEWGADIGGNGGDATEKDNSESDSVSIAHITSRIGLMSRRGKGLFDSEIKRGRGEIPSVWGESPPQRIAQDTDVQRGRGEAAPARKDSPSRRGTEGVDGGFGGTAAGVDELSMRFERISLSSAYIEKRQETNVRGPDHKGTDTSQETQARVQSTHGVVCRGDAVNEEKVRSDGLLASSTSPAPLGRRGDNTWGHSDESGHYDGSGHARTHTHGTTPPPPPNDDAEGDKDAAMFWSPELGRGVYTRMDPHDTSQRDDGYHAHSSLMEASASASGLSPTILEAVTPTNMKERVRWGLDWGYVTPPEVRARLGSNHNNDDDNRVQGSNNGNDRVQGAQTGRQLPHMHAGFASVTPLHAGGRRQAVCEMQGDIFKTAVKKERARDLFGAGGTDTPTRIGLVTPAASVSSLEFRKVRDALAQQLVQELNATVFHSRLPRHLPIIWTSAYWKTAGMTSMSKVYRENPTNLQEARVEYCSKVELSNKVVDNADRLRRTLAHELCHVAQWVVDHEADPIHGPAFTKWAKALEAYDPSIRVDVCHEYDINFKYKYRCTDCGEEYGRHTKSIDVATKVCGECQGRLELPMEGTATPRAPSAFALFVKHNFQKARETLLRYLHQDALRTPRSVTRAAQGAMGRTPPHTPTLQVEPAMGTVMQLLSKMWKAEKKESGSNTESARRGRKNSSSSLAMKQLPSASLRAEDMFLSPTSVLARDLLRDISSDASKLKSAFKKPKGGAATPLAPSKEGMSVRRHRE